MPNVTYISFTGETTTIDVPVDTTVMENAIKNGIDGIVADSANAASVTSLSNCVFANNTFYGVYRENFGPVSTRGNNTGAGNGSGATGGTIGSFTGF